MRVFLHNRNIRHCGISVNPVAPDPLLQIVTAYELVTTFGRLWLQSLQAQDQLVDALWS
jgi:hypothetical protein